MGFFGDFVEGATDLPRQLGAGIATHIFGSDSEAAQKTFGINQEDTSTPTHVGEIAKQIAQQNTSVWQDITNRPGFYLGEMVPYALLPGSLFGGAATKAAAYGSKAAIAGKVADTAATFGVYSGADTAIRDMNLSPENRDSIIGSSLSGALFGGAMVGAMKGAVVGARAIKGRAAKSRHIQSFLKKHGMQPKDIKTFAAMSENEQINAIDTLHDKFKNIYESVNKSAENIIEPVKPEVVPTPSLVQAVTDSVNSMKDIIRK